MHKTLLTYGIGESRLAERIEAWEDNLPEFIKLAYLPNLGKVRLRLSAKGKNKDSIEAEMNTQIKLLLPQIDDVFVGFQELDESLEQLVGKLLIDKGFTLSVAESCTGGAIAQQLTRHSGASAFFKGSLVCYATQSKIDLLGVDEAIINQYSVVSREVAEAMALQAKKLYKSNYAIATTGNAGPTKGDADVEVGTVCIAIASNDRVFSEKFTFGNHRTRVINKAVNKAFEMLYKEISKK